jgi:hypothetical protein
LHFATALTAVKDAIEEEARAKKIGLQIREADFLNQGEKLGAS